jgi:multidrug resistance efflux pump
MEPHRTLARAAFVICLAAFAVPAAAELYRWTDGQGREHFAMSLHEVPPEHRAAAQHRLEMEKIQVERPPEPNVNTMKTPDGMAVKRALRPRYPGSTSSYPTSSDSRSARTASGDAGCSDADRKQAEDLARAVERWTHEVEEREERQRRLVETDDRLQNEDRIADAQERLEKAEQALDDFETRMRKQGVPPGCFN